MISNEHPKSACFIPDHPLQRVFFATKLFSAVADQTLAFAVPLIVFRKTGSLSASAFAYFVQWLPKLISLPVSGNLVDRFGSPKLIQLADVFRCLAVSLCYLTMEWDGLGQTPLFIAVGICSYMGGQQFVALEHHLTTTTSGNLRVKAHGKLQAIDQLSVIVGPALGALLFSQFSQKAALGFASACYFVSFLTSRNLTQPPVLGSDKSNWWKSTCEATQIIFRSGRLVQLVFATAALNFLLGTTHATMVPIAKSLFDMSDAKIGMTQTVSAMVGVGLYFVNSRIFDGYRVALSAKFSLFSIAIGVAFLCISKSSFWFASGYVLTTSVVGLFNVYIRSERARLMDPSRAGRLIGQIVMLNQLTLPLSALAVSALGRSLEPLATLRLLSPISVVCLLLVGLFLFSFGEKHEKRPYHC
jgi:hypothetical protein